MFGIAIFNISASRYSKALSDTSLRIAREEREALSELMPAAVAAAADDILSELGVNTAIPPAAILGAAMGLLGWLGDIAPLLAARLSPLAGEVLRPLPALG
jgi:hypothetical protein